MHNNNGSMECNTVALSGTRTTLPFAVASIHPSILEQHFIPSGSVRQAGRQRMRQISDDDDDDDK